MRKYWGWGNDDFEINADTLAHLKAMVQMSFGMKDMEPIEPKNIEALELRAPQFKLAEQLINFCTDLTFDRASHSYGKSFRDVWRALHGLFPCPPDYVAYPDNELQLASLMQFAGENRVALIPYGGGSSVVGGVEACDDDGYTGSITVDMKNFNKVLEVDKESRCARIQAGIYGPELEKELKEHGLTLRHYPQSFEFSTLGGWIATRAAGHYATLFTHIDEFVQSVKMISPSGLMNTMRLPVSGVGPSEERLICGSEGIFGIITEAWMRVQQVPQYKSSAVVTFNDFNDGIAAARAIAQSGLNPSNARLVDSMEAFINGIGDGQKSVLLLGFESHNHAVDEPMNNAFNLCKQFNGVWNEGMVLASSEKKNDTTADQWKNSFLQAPYIRDELIRWGMIVETFETSTTWKNFAAFHKQIIETVQNTLAQNNCAGFITCRITHLYPDGLAPYYTVIAKGERGKELENWDKIKSIVSAKIVEAGGSITHHHAVGKDHLPYYSKQRTDAFGKILSSVKDTLDPNWILNPGVLIGKK